jgi:hypothetical protein
MTILLGWGTIIFSLFLPILVLCMAGEDDFMTTLASIARIFLILGMDLLTLVAEPLVHLLLYVLMCAVLMPVYLGLYWLWYRRLPEYPRLARQHSDRIYS